MEIWDILDSNGVPTGRTIQRGATLKADEYHLVVHIWVFNSADKTYYIQRRAEHLPLAPGIWATAGGSAIAGEDSLTAARRELKEEMGLDLPPQSFSLLFRRTRQDDLTDVWLAFTDVPLAKLIPQEAEVAEITCATKEDIEKMLIMKTFHDYGPDYLRTLFSLTRIISFSKEPF